MLRTRRVFVTSDGNLELGLETARVGGGVAVIHGSGAPLILRENMGGDEMKGCEVVGQCYLEDAMYGEAFTWSES